MSALSTTGQIGAGLPPMVPGSPLAARRSPLRHFLRLAASGMNRLRIFVTCTRAEREMMSLPDHLLKDIGVNRGEIAYRARFGRLEAPWFE